MMASYVVSMHNPPPGNGIYCFTDKVEVRVAAETYALLYDTDVTIFVERGRQVETVETVWPDDVRRANALRVKWSQGVTR